MTNTELLLLKETLKMSFQVSEYRINFLNEESSTHYKASRKKFIQFVEEENLKVKLVDGYPEDMEAGVCYIQRSGKMVWIKIKVK